MLRLTMVIVAAGVAAMLVQLDSEKGQSAHAKSAPPPVCAYSGTMLPMAKIRPQPRERGA